MNSNLQHEYVRAVHEDRMARYRAEARDNRLSRELASEHRIRRALGRSLVRVGERLAAEPADLLEPAASR